jgi:ectoine hydroxylase-related dioxygenase (phytanoyl-CoA dioxygenase family)
VLEENGYTILPAVLGQKEAAALEDAVAAVQVSSAGTRNLLMHSWCRAVSTRLRSALSLSGVAVQCTLFDKTPIRNWLVPLHQDLSIPVAERVEHPELRAWSVKEGQHFVQPPAELLEQLLAVRLHLDGCVQNNGPLRVVPGSHRNGRLDSAAARRLRDQLGEVSCPVEKGGVLLLRPLLLHASSKASSPGHRRVLHFLFGPASIGYGLRWQDAV